MAWMIMLMKESDIGKGCRDCRFLNDLKKKAECIADNHISVYRNGKIDTRRPYECPFRYFDKEIRQIVEQFDGMTVDETRGWFDGANHEHTHYVRLEEERESFVSSNIYKQWIILEKRMPLPEPPKEVTD